MVSKSKGNRTQVLGYYDSETVTQLRRLSELTRVPQAAYLREALEDLLGKYASVAKQTSSQVKPAAAAQLRRGK